MSKLQALVNSPIFKTASVVIITMTVAVAVESVAEKLTAKPII